MTEPIAVAPREPRFRVNQTVGCITAVIIALVAMGWCEANENSSNPRIGDLVRVQAGLVACETKDQLSRALENQADRAALATSILGGNGCTVLAGSPMVYEDLEVAGPIRLRYPTSGNSFWTTRTAMLGKAEAVGGTSGH
jgi:hypothetical protein